MPSRQSQVMGVVNVTPDSFSDGGRYFDHEAAIAHGRRLVAEGADWVDVGGESTRPGAEPVPADEELRRVLPVVEALAASGAQVSIDTRKPEVAEAAVAAGARLINDVTAGLAEVAAATGAAFVAMHMQGEPRTMQAEPAYDDVVAEVRDALVERATAARDRGRRRGVDRPRHRVREDAGPQPRPARQPRRAGGDGLPGAGRHQPQGHPRPARRPGRRHRRRPAPRRPARRLGGDGRVGLPSGRGHGPGTRGGGHRVAARAAFAAGAPAAAPAAAATDRVHREEQSWHR